MPDSPTPGRDLPPTLRIDAESDRDGGDQNGDAGQSRISLDGDALRSPAVQNGRVSFSGMRSMLGAPPRPSRASEMVPQRAVPEAVKLYLTTEEELMIDANGLPDDPRGQQLLELLRAQNELSDRKLLLKTGRYTFRTKSRRRSSTASHELAGVNLLDTFRYMQYRKMERQRSGNYKPSNSSRILWVTFTLVIFLALLGVLGSQYFYQGTSLTNLLVTVVVFPLFFFVIVKITLIFRMVFYLFMLGVIAYVSTNLYFVYDPKPEFKECPFCDPRYGEVVKIIIAVTASVAGSALLLFLFIRYAYPRIVKYSTISSVDVERWWKLRPLRDAYVSPSRTWAWANYTYQAWDSTRWRLSTNSFSYRGGMGPDGKPHGWGEWKDDSALGECLTGFWEHGLPSAPFRARETGTGNAFKAIRMGFVSCANRPWDNPTFIPALNPRGLSWGFATVECSVAGSFFGNLPDAQMILAPTFPADNPDVIDDVIEGLNVGTVQLENDAGQQAIIDLGKIGSVAAGTSSTEANLAAFRNASASDQASSSVSPSVPLSLPTVPLGAIESQEALVFIPGFNSNSKWAMRTLAQLLTLAEFPNRIKPFVFSWPGGRELSFFQAKAVASSAETQELFVQALKELGKRFRGIHLFAHSMGPRIPLGILDRLSEVFMDLEELRRFQVEEQDPNSQMPPSVAPKPRLLSLTLLNSESPLKDFVDRQFQVFRRYCDLITVYTDQEDGALGIAEFFTRLNLFEPKEHDYRALGYSTGGLYHKFRDEVGQTSKEPDLEIGLARATASSVGAPEVEMELLGGGTQHGTIRTSWTGHRETEIRVRRRWLDLDVVDTTLLKVNVQALRHAYFALQRSLVDDLFDIICRGLRARERERLLHVEYNLYGFLVAPPYVDSVKA